MMVFILKVGFRRQGKILLCACFSACFNKELEGLTSTQVLLMILAFSTQCLGVKQLSVVFTLLLFELCRPAPRDLQK